jgi:hypothetical protein
MQHPRKQEPMKISTPIVFAGAFGAIAPNLVGMAQQALRGHPDAGASYLYGEAGFWVGTLVFAVLGFGIVLFYEEKSPRRAVALGAAAPALVLGWAQGTSGSSAQQARGDAAPPFPAVVTVAYAAEPTGASATALQRDDTTWVVVSGLSAEDTGSELVAILGPTGPQPARMVFRLDASSPPIALPPGTQSVSVVVGGAESNRLTVAGGDTLKLQVTYTDGSFWKGFRRAFGLRDAAGRRPLLRANT